MDQKRKANRVAIGKIVFGSAKMASGLATGAGKGLVGSYCKSHHLTSAGIQLARYSLQSGRKLIEEGWSELNRE